MAENLATIYLLDDDRWIELFASRVRTKLFKGRTRLKVNESAVAIPQFNQIQVVAPKFRRPEDGKRFGGCAAARLRDAQNR